MKVFLYLTPEDEQIIERRRKMLNIPRKSPYYRKTATEGLVVRLVLPELKEVSSCQDRILGCLNRSGPPVPLESLWEEIKEELPKISEATGKMVRDLKKLVSGLKKWKRQGKSSGQQPVPVRSEEQAEEAAFCREVQVYIQEGELKIIQGKMDLLGVRNRNRYMLIMAKNGYMLNIAMPELEPILDAHSTIREKIKNLQGTDSPEETGDGQDPADLLASITADFRSILFLLVEVRKNALY